MRKRRVIKILSEINSLKKAYGFSVVDTHIHPIDVMGVVHQSEIVDECQHSDYLKPGILEYFSYSKFEKICSRLSFKLLPQQINSIIRNTYGKVNDERILEEMEVALTDKSVLLSVDPWAPTEIIGNKYAADKRFFILGSVDIHSIELSKIEEIIKSYVNRFNIVGLKFHPNLQNFKPQPSENEEGLADKLRKVYETAAKYKLYLLFHGGISNYTDKVNQRFGYIGRSKTNGLLKNFCRSDGSSEILGKYGIPIIIAHIGHYGLANPDYGLIKMIGKRFSDVFFDTSGISPLVISNTLKILPSSKLVFGSDAIYNRIAYNLAFLYEGISGARNKEKIKDMLINVTGRNFYNYILKK